jgi:hypothetical protein
MGATYTPQQVHDSRERLFPALTRVLLERYRTTMPAPSDGFDPTDYPGYVPPFTAALNQYLDQQVDQLLNMVDLNAIQERAVRLNGEVQRLRSDQHIHTEIDQGHDLIAEWAGTAADGTKRQITDLKGYVTEKHHPIAAVAALYAALGKITVSAWGSYCQLADATIAACDQAIGNVTSAQKQFALAEGILIAKSVFTAIADPKGMPVVAIDFTFDTVDNGKDVDSDLEKVFESHENWFHQLYKNFTDGINEAIKATEDTIREHLSIRPALEEPVPVSPKIHEPNFSYDQFRPASGGPDPAVFSTKVKKAAADGGKAGTGQPGGRSLIERRLDGDV